MHVPCSPFGNRRRKNEGPILMNYLVKSLFNVYYLYLNKPTIMRANHSIRDLEHLSGIKAHTIRMWEQRYGILSPNRSSTNIRSYTDEDLKSLLNIAVLNRQGMRISLIASMSPKEIEGSVEEASLSTGIPEGHVDSLVLAMIDLDEGRFEKIINTSTLRIGFEETMREVVFPFLNRIGVMWQTGSITPAHEHFVTCLIRQKIIVAIDGQYVKEGPSSKTLMLFLPEGEWHEITLLFLHYALKKRNHRVIYLGASVPFDDLVSVGRTREFDCLYMVGTTQPSNADLEGYLMRLADAFPGRNIAVSGARFQDYHGRMPLGIRLLENEDAVLGFLESL